MTRTLHTFPMTEAVATYMASCKALDKVWDAYDNQEGDVNEIDWWGDQVHFDHRVMYETVGFDGDEAHGMVCAAEEMLS